MATFSGLAPVRDDFRCSLCRQKDVFHCEHDTPYRDQLLGTYGQEKPYVVSAGSRRSSHRIDSHNKNSSANNKRLQNSNTGRDINSNTDARHQQGKKPENHSSSNPNPNPNANGSIKIDEQKKKNKSCVIL